MPLRFKNNPFRFQGARRRALVRGVARSRYIFFRRRAAMLRRAARRRRLRPEIKFVDTVIPQFDVPQNGQAFGALTPTNYPTGVGTQGRIGGQIKTRKLVAMMQMDSFDTTATDTTSNGVFRLVIWSPRIDFSEANTYMGSLSFNRPIDFNVVTVHKDMWINIGFQQYLFTYGSTEFHNSNPIPARIHKTLVFPFLRKIRFRQSEDAASTTKDMIYYRFYNPNNFGVRCNISTRVTFIDV